VYWFKKANIDTKNYKMIIDNLVKDIKPVSDERYSTRGLNAKQYDLYDYKDSLSVIVDQIKIELKKIFNKSFYNLVAAWTVYGEENCYHIAHRHNENSNHISSVLYLSVPDNTNLHQSGNFYYFMKDKQNNLLYNHLTPKLGDLYLMPIDMFHGTYPQSKGLRQTLNLDFEIINA